MLQVLHPSRATLIYHMTAGIQLRNSERVPAKPSLLPSCSLLTSLRSAHYVTELHPVGWVHHQCGGDSTALHGLISYLSGHRQLR